MYETHGIDMAQVVPSTDPTSTEKKKKIPNLLKITDLKFKNDLPGKLTLSCHQITVYIKRFKLFIATKPHLWQL